jgi:hypothetical protein
VTVPNTGDFNYSITVPSTYDSGGAISFAWVNPIWANRLYLIVDPTVSLLTTVTLSKYSYTYNQNDNFNVIVNNTLGSTGTFTFNMYNGSVSVSNLISSTSLPINGGATLTLNRNILSTYTNSVTVVVSANYTIP